MSIATQITRLNNNINNMKTTKQEIKEAINNDFDIIANEQIEDYAELIEDGLELYKDCIPSVETEQATEITVDDTMKYGRNKLQLFGNTEQAQYSGKNLLKPGTTKTENGITFSVQEDGTIIANGTATANASINLGTKDGSLIDLPAGTYTISGCPSNGSSTTYRMGANLGGGNIFDYGNGVTTTLASDVTDKRIWCIVYSGVTVNNLVFKPMLEIGDAKTDYEPYVGGQPSPSPDYPQDIHVVTGNNTISIGNTNYPVNLGSIELCKIGEYQDYLYKENGNWYKYGAIKEWKSEDYINNVWQKTQTTDEYSYFFTNSKDTLIKSGIYNGYCNLLNVRKSLLVVGTEVKTDTINYGDSGYAKIRIKIKTNRLSEDSIQGLKDWFSSVDVTSLIILATPTITQITDESLIAQLDVIWEHLQLEKGTNHITVTASDLKPYMKLSYKNYESNLTNE